MREDKGIVIIAYMIEYRGHASACPQIVDKVLAYAGAFLMQLSTFPLSFLFIIKKKSVINLKVK